MEVSFRNDINQTIGLNSEVQTGVGTKPFKPKLSFPLNFVLFLLFLQEFGVLGFSSLFTPSRNGSGLPDTFDIVKLVNSTYELLQQQQRSAKQRTDLEVK